MNFSILVFCCVGDDGIRWQVAKQFRIRLSLQLAYRLRITSISDCRNYMLGALAGPMMDGLETFTHQI
jgi:hypothetical protein